MSQKFRVKFLLAECLWTEIEAFLHFWGWVFVYTQVLRKWLLWSWAEFTPREKKGWKVSNKVMRNSTWWSFTLNFWLMKLAPCLIAMFNNAKVNVNKAGWHAAQKVHLFCDVIGTNYGRSLLRLKKMLLWSVSLLGPMMKTGAPAKKSNFWSSATLDGFAFS